MMNIFLAMGAAVVSGLLGVIVTLVVQVWNGKRRQKIEVFRTLLANRQQLTSEENVKALNMIDVVFYKHETVRMRFAEFIAASNMNPANGVQIVTRYLRLVEAIGVAVGMGDIDWDRINSCYYNPIALSERTLENDLLRKAMLQNQMELVNKRNAIVGK